MAPLDTVRAAGWICGVFTPGAAIPALPRWRLLRLSVGFCVVDLAVSCRAGLGAAAAGGALAVVGVGGLLVEAVCVTPTAVGAGAAAVLGASRFTVPLPAWIAEAAATAIGIFVWADGGVFLLNRVAVGAAARVSCGVETVCGA